MVLLSTVKTRSKSTFDSLYAFASFTYFKIPASRSSATTITATETIANLRLFFISKLYQTYADYAIFSIKLRTAGSLLWLRYLTVNIQDMVYQPVCEILENSHDLLILIYLLITVMLNELIQLLHKFHMLNLLCKHLLVMD